MGDAHKNAAAQEGNRLVIHDGDQFMKSISNYVGKLNFGHFSAPFIS